MQTAWLNIPLGGVAESYRQTPGQADYINDLALENTGAWVTVGGFGDAVPWGEGATPGATGSGIWTLTSFSQHSGRRQWIVFEEEQADGTLDLKYINYTYNNAFAIQEDRTLIEGGWQRTQYLQFGNWLYMVNGYDAPVRWNGSYLRPVGFDRIPPSPVVVSPSSDNAMDLVGMDFENDLFSTIPTAPRAIRQDELGRGLSYSPLYGTSASAFTSAGGGAGLTVSAEHREIRYAYAVSWVNDLGQESPVSGRVIFRTQIPKLTYAAGVGSYYLGRSIAVIRLPEAPDNVRAVRIYRSTVLADAPSASATVIQPLYFHSEYETGVAMTIIDDHRDAELGMLLDESKTGVMPRAVKYLAHYKGTMWAAGAVEYPDRVFFSAALFPEQFPSSNYVALEGRDSGPVTGMYPTRNALVVFRRRAVILIKGDPASGFSQQVLSVDIGSTSPNAMAEVPGVGLFFVSEEGPYILEGAFENTGTPTRARPAWSGISRTWRKRVNRLHLMDAQATVCHLRNEVWLQVPADGDWRPSLGLALHWPTGQWSFREDWPIMCMTESQDERKYVHFGSWDTTQAGVHIISPGYGTKGSAAINSIYRTGWLEAEDRALVHYVQGRFLGQGDEGVTYKVRRDHELPFTNVSDVVRKQENVEYPQARWGTALWGDASTPSRTWTDYTPTRVRDSLYGEAALELQVEISGEKMSLFALDLGARKPLKIVQRES